MDIAQYRRVILDQREDLGRQNFTDMVKRTEQEDININSQLVQIVSGIRRCGKSTLAWMALQKENYAYLNFDDERLINLQTSDLDQLLEALYMVYGDFTHLLLDELQNIKSWHLFVNRLLRKGIKIVLTGSNSKLLSREMASHLTGRYSTIDLYPYSFREYLDARKLAVKKNEIAHDRGVMLRYLLDYMKIGGFPEVVGGENQQKYVSTLFDAIISRDIIYRYNIRNIRTFREIAYWLSANFASEISYNRIKNIFGLGSENTAKNYVSYLEEAWLFVSLSKFSFKKQESIRNRKLYLIDLSFSGLTGENATKNEGRLLENLVLLHLMRKKNSGGYEIYYYKTTIEVDFVIYQHNHVEELIQVSWTMENIKTRNREIRALISASRKLDVQKLTIITLNTQEVIEKDGLKIQVQPILARITQ